MNPPGANKGPLRPDIPPLIIMEIACLIPGNSRTNCSSTNRKKIAPNYMLRVRSVKVYSPPFSI
jgi:hypothetical protein